MAKLYGESNNYALFVSDEFAAIVDKSTGFLEDSGFLADLIVFHPWETAAEHGQHDAYFAALASEAIGTFKASAPVVAAGNSRLYTIPNGVQEEAKKALEWRKEHKRGGTPVGMNTARILANGGQIGLKKVRHIAKYFPRHEVDKKGKGYKPGSDGFPSAGRIAWGLWGGDAAWKWAQTIVDRENAALKASAEYSHHEPVSLYDADVDQFEIAREHDGLSNSPDFVARVRLDGTGIDRLYMIDQLGNAFVWDGGIWDDLGHSDSDIFAYDNAIDDPYDSAEKHHIVIDPESALIISARLQANPFKSVRVADLDEEESRLVAAAADEIDWAIVDSAIVAAGEEPLSGKKNADGVYTPEERSENAKQQVRDKTGRFSKVGARVMVDGNSSATGSVTGIDKSTGDVTVAMDDGSTQIINSKRTEAVGESKLEKGEQIANAKTAPVPLDVSGILAQPRAPIDRPKAIVPGGLPALTGEDLRQIMYDFPAWVNNERTAAKSKESSGSSGGSKPPKVAPVVHEAGDYAAKHKKSDFIKGVEKETGKSLFIDSAFEHPMLKDFFSNPANKLWYNPITSAAEPAAGTDSKPAKTLGDPLTPETSDVPPMYVAIVSPDDPAAVMDLVAVVPAATNSTQPATFKRVDGKWEPDPQILSDLTSATPPPVVALNGEAYNDVLSQVDQAMAASAYIFDKDELSARFVELYTAQINPLVAVGVEGGLDRNRGNAEKLRRYWLYGRGAMKIRWNTPGDWTRCYRHLRKYMGVRAKGYCALRHKEATGVWTGSKLNVGKRSVRGGGYDSHDVASLDAVLNLARVRAVSASIKESGLVAGGLEQGKCGSSFKIPLVIPEDIETGDGRVFKKGAISVRDLPLPLLWQIKTGEGHDGSVVVGRIDGMERINGGMGNAYGVFDAGPYGQEAERMVRNGFLRGVSADLDRFEASEDEDDDFGIEEDDESLAKSSKKSGESIKKKKKISSSKIVVDKARVMAVTIVPKPAFEECKIYIDNSQEEVREGEMPAVPDGIYVDTVDSADAEALVACGMIASSIPVVPPADWFKNPQLSGPTPLTVDDSGRVFGHIASWRQDHIGMAFGTKPPRSRSGYAYFHTGVVRADDGKDYQVGQLTLSGGHASLEASAVDAARHYDDTGSAIADVHAGEDAHGIWVAGSLRPAASPEQVRALRASAPSGDWRPIGGALELVAVCQVNVPGFPIARARVASGQVYALVAAGAATLARMKHEQSDSLTRRIEKLEELAGMSTLDQIKAVRSGADTGATTRAASSDLSVKADALAIKMRSGIKYNELGYISKKTREQLAKDGKALPDGSYPIRSVAELRNAIQAYGRSKPEKRAAVRRHIMKRARDLHRPDLIPEDWKSAGLIDDNVVSDLQARVASARLVIENVTTEASTVDTSVVDALKARVASARAELASKSDDKEVWEKDNPKGKSTPLTPAQKAAAKRAAKKAGRPYPNMVDNMNAAKKAKKAASASTEDADTPKALADQALVAAGGTVIAEESDLAKALIDIAEKYGKFNEDDTGVWAGYTPASENENAEIGVNCSNCILYAGGSECKILAMPVEPLGSCRFALIPDGLVNKK